MSALSKAFSPAVRELRILCCQTGQASSGARQFIQSAYPAIKKANPDLPVLIREASGTPARVFARFGERRHDLASHVGNLQSERGVEKHVDVDNLSASDIERKVSELIKA